MKKIKLSEVLTVLKIYLQDNFAPIFPTLTFMFFVFAGYSFYCYGNAVSDRLTDRCTLEVTATVQDRIAVGNEEEGKVSYYFLYLYKVNNRNYKVCSSIDISDSQVSFLVNEKVSLMVNPKDASECYESNSSKALKEKEQAFINKSFRNGVLFVLLALACFIALYVRAAWYVLQKIKDITTQEVREQRQKTWDSVDEQDIIDVEFID